MEIALAALLAGTAFFATWAFTARNNERARAHRLAEELEALRKPSHVPAVETAGGTVAPDTASFSEEPSSDAVGAPDPSPIDGELVRAARGAIAQALAALADHQHSDVSSEEETSSEPGASSLETLKEDARSFLSVADGIETKLSNLLLRTSPFRSSPAVVVAPAIPSEREAVPSRTEEELISDASAAIEELSDPTSRMADDLGSVLRNAERIRSGAIQAGAALATVSRSADSLTPLASALSSLSNRINLLALNLAVLVNPGARDSGEFDKAGDELRGLFEETRRLSREVGSLSQRAAGAARSANETSVDLVAAATDGHARAEHGMQELAHLEELTVQLKEDLEQTRVASRRALEQHLRLRQQVSSAQAAEGALEVHLRELHADAERWASDLRGFATAFHDTRTAGDRAVRALIGVCERLPLTRGPVPVGSRCAELLTRADSLLQRLTVAGPTDETSGQD